MEGKPKSQAQEHVFDDHILQNGWDGKFWFYFCVYVIFIYVISAQLSVCHPYLFPYAIGIPVNISHQQILRLKA